MNKFHGLFGFDPFSKPANFDDFSSPDFGLSFASALNSLHLAYFMMAAAKFSCVFVIIL